MKKILKLMKVVFAAVALLRGRDADAKEDDDEAEVEVVGGLDEGDDYDADGTTHPK